MSTDELHNSIDQAIERSIKKYVNGKIDAMDKKLDTHIATMEPVIEGVRFINTSRRFVLWIATPVGAFAGLWVAVKNLL